jgi:hypothetical protein
MITIYRKVIPIILAVCLPVLALSAGDFGKAQSRRLFTRPVFHRSLLTKEVLPAVQSGTRAPSPAAGMVLSLVLPGAGELYTGSRKMASIFFGAEVLFWSAFASFRVYGLWKKNDYEQFAVSHAGISLSGKDHDYFLALEHYDNVRAYNEAKLRERDFDALYPETSEYNWQWDSRSSRLEYETLRVASDRAFERSLIVIGGIVLNHLVSAVDALRLGRKTREKRETGGTRNPVEMPLQMGLAGLPEGGIRIMAVKHF